MKYVYVYIYVMLVVHLRHRYTFTSTFRHTAFHASCKLGHVDGEKTGEKGVPPWGKRVENVGREIRRPMILVACLNLYWNTFLICLYTAIKVVIIKKILLARLLNRKCMEQIVAKMHCECYLLKGFLMSPDTGRFRSAMLRMAGVKFA